MKAVMFAAAALAAFTLLPVAQAQAREGGNPHHAMQYGKGKSHGYDKRHDTRRYGHHRGYNKHRTYNHHKYVYRYPRKVYVPTPMVRYYSAPPYYYQKRTYYREQPAVLGLNLFF